MSNRWFRNAEPALVWPKDGGQVTIKVPGDLPLPTPPGLADAVARWNMLVWFLRSSDQFLVTGGRGVITGVTVRRPDYARREHERPASDPLHRGPTVPGSTYTDVER